MTTTTTNSTYKLTSSASVKARIIPPYKGKLKLNYKLTHSITGLLSAGSFVYCWERGISGKWKANGLLLVDAQGYLRHIHPYLKQQYHSTLQPVYYLNARNLVLYFCFNQQQITEHAPYFIFEEHKDKEYAFVFAPVDLICNPEYAKGMDIRIDYYFDNLFNDAPPKAAWLDKTAPTAFVFKVKANCINDGIMVPPSFTEWLAIVYRTVADQKYCTANFMRLKKPHLETLQLLQYVMDIIEATRDCPKERVVNKTAIGENETQFQDRLTWGIELVDTLSANIMTTVFSAPEYIKAEKAYHERSHRLLQRNIDVLQSKDFLASYAAMVAQATIANIPFLECIGDNQVSRLMSDAYAEIAISPDTTLAKSFYLKEILPYKIRMAYSLTTEELNAVQELLTPEMIKNSFPYLSDKQILDHVAAIDTTLAKDIGLEELITLASNLHAAIEPSTICAAGSILKQWAESPLNNFWVNQGELKTGLGLVLSYFEQMSQAHLLEQPLTGKLDYCKYVLGLRAAVKLTSSDKPEPLSPKISMPGSPKRQPKKFTHTKIAPYNKAEHVKKLTAKGLSKVWHIAVNTKDGANAKEFSDAPYAIHFAFSSLAIAGGIFGLIETQKELEKKKQEGTIGYIDYLKFYKSIGELGLATTGMSPYNLEKLPIIGKMLTCLSTVVEPITLWLSVFDYGSQCYKSWNREEYGSAAFKGLLTLEKGLVGTIVLKNSFVKLFTRKAVQEAALKVGASFIKVETGIGTIWTMYDIFSTIPAIIHTIQKTVIKPLGAVDYLVNEMLEQRFNCKDKTDAGFDTYAVYKNVFGSHSIPPYGPNAAPYKWDKIRDWVLGKGVMGITSAYNLAYRDLEMDKAIWSLNKKGLPSKIIAMALGMEEATVSKRILEMNTTNKVHLDDMTDRDTKPMTDSDRAKLKEQARNWLNTNGVTISL